MPKVSKIQASFSSGEISRSVYGRVDNEHYDLAMAGCFNYLPIIQGPLIRRPGTKFVTYSKDPTKAPTLVPFQFSAVENYMLEFGDKYIRFYTNEGRVVTTSNSFTVAGFYGLDSKVSPQGFFNFTGIRPNFYPSGPEILSASSLVAAGSVLEIPTWYAWKDVGNIKFTQKQDALFLTHTSYPPAKLVKTGLNNWDLKQLIFQDGPYLPLNTYSTIADNANTFLTPAQNFNGNSSHMSVTTGPTASIDNITALAGNITQISILNNPFNTGDKIFISGVSGLPTINNVSDTNNQITNSAASQAYYSVLSSNSAQINISGFFAGSYIGSTGNVFPALCQLVTGSSFQYWNDIQVGSSIPNNGSIGAALRNIAFVQSGTRYWGNITAVKDAAHFTVVMGPGQILPTTASSVIWQLGVYSNAVGFPGACCFHQDRFVLTGPPGHPQEVDASMTSLYEVFSASGSNFQVNNNNALQFNLSSQDLNATRWVKSNYQGLVLGTQNSEWTISPSTQSPALTPTNINAQQVSFFGSYDADAIPVNNSIVYVQRSQNKVRELLYFWQIGNFRSTNISELAEHIAIPGFVKLVNQKEPHPIIWGLKSDGSLAALTYTRDDVTFQTRAGWSRHQLGGASDSAGSPPIINSIGVIPSGDASYDEMWLAVKRYTNGSSLCSIEYMSKPFNDATPQEMSYHFDCGATYNSSIVVTGISIGGSSLITSPNHGLLNSSTIRFYNTVGLNVSKIDADGNVGSSNIFNEQTFLTTSVSTNTFFVKDFLGNYINTGSASVYVGSAVVRKLVTTVSGLGWLAGEQVSVLADGGIHVNTSVSSAGVLQLSYPAAVVSVGYQYNSDGQLLRTKDGSAQGSAIGSTRRVNRVAFMLHNVGDLSFGSSFQKLIPAEFAIADADRADTAPVLFDGIHRDGIEAPYGFTDTVCFRQNSGLPGMVQAIVRFFEEFDV